MSTANPFEGKDWLTGGYGHFDCKRCDGKVHIGTDWTMADVFDKMVEFAEEHAGCVELPSTPRTVLLRQVGQHDLYIECNGGVHREPHTLINSAGLRVHDVRLRAGDLMPPHVPQGSPRQGWNELKRHRWLWEYGIRHVDQAVAAARKVFEDAGYAVTFEQAPSPREAALEKLKAVDLSPEERAALGLRA